MSSIPQDPPPKPGTPAYEMSIKAEKDAALAAIRGFLEVLQRDFGKAKRQYHEARKAYPEDPTVGSGFRETMDALNGRIQQVVKVIAKFETLLNPVFILKVGDKVVGKGFAGVGEFMGGSVRLDNGNTWPYPLENLKHVPKESSDG